MIDEEAKGSKGNTGYLKKSLCFMYAIRYFNEEKYLLVMGKAKGAEQVEWAGGFGQRRRLAGVLNPSWNKRSVASIMFREGQHAKHAQPRDDNIKDGTEDANHNGKIDGDNGDGIYGESEIWTETSPNLADSDDDEISDYWEIEYKYDPLSNDTDGDGLLDSEEDADRDGKWDKENDETDPTKSDSDGDGLTDSLELNGWIISVFEEKDGSIIEEYHEDSDPNKIDTEGDGLSDFDEYVHGSDPEKSNTDGDFKNDFEEVNEESGSTPTGKDGIPPIIVELQYSIDEKYNDYKVTKMPSGYKLYSKIECEDIDSYVTYIEFDLKGIDSKRIDYGESDSAIFEHTFEFGYVKGIKNGILLNGLDVEIISSDVCGNVGEIEFTTESIFDIVVTEVGIALSKVMDITSDIFNTIENAIKSIIVDIFKPIFENLIMSIPIKDILSVIDQIKYGVMSFIELCFNILKLIIDSISEVICFVFSEIYIPVINTLLKTFFDYEIDWTEVEVFINRIKDIIYDNIDKAIDYIKDTKSLNIIDDMENSIGIFSDIDFGELLGLRNVYKGHNKENNIYHSKNNISSSLKENSLIETILLTGSDNWVENKNWNKIMKNKYNSNIMLNVGPGDDTNKIDWKFKELKDKDKSNNTLVLFISLHGTKDHFILPNGKIMNYEKLNNYISPLNYNQIYFIIDSCYSQNALSVLKENSDLIISSSSNNQVSLGRISLSLSVILSNRYSPYIDYNSDGSIGFDEAYKYMINNDINGLENPILYISSNYKNSLSIKKDFNIEVNVDYINHFRDYGISEGSAAAVAANAASLCFSGAVFLIVCNLIHTYQYPEETDIYRKIKETIDNENADISNWGCILDLGIDIDSRIFDKKGWGINEAWDMVEKAKDVIRKKINGELWKFDLKWSNRHKNRPNKRAHLTIIIFHEYPINPTKTEYTECGFNINQVAQIIGFSFKITAIMYVFHLRTWIYQYHYNVDFLNYGDKTRVYPELTITTTHGVGVTLPPPGGNELAEQRFYGG